MSPRPFRLRKISNPPLISGFKPYGNKKNKDAQEGAGPASVQTVASRNVQKIISGEFGIKIKSLLDSLKIQMIVLKEPDKKIEEIINMLNN